MHTDSSTCSPTAPASAAAAAEGSSRLSSTALLWASAFILLGLVIVQSGRVAAHWLVPEARADVVSRVADYTTATVYSGSGSEDILVVLDGRGEQVFTYRVKNKNSLEFVKRYDLATLFEMGTRIGAGRVK